MLCQTKLAEPVKRITVETGWRLFSNTVWWKSLSFYVVILNTFRDLFIGDYWKDSKALVVAGCELQFNELRHINSVVMATIVVLIVAG